MLTEAERHAVFKGAYIPEHLPDYVEGVTHAQPHIHEGYLCYTRDGVLVFVGYPLHADSFERISDDLPTRLVSACERFQPATVSLIAASIPADAHATILELDRYFRLNLPLNATGGDEAYMVRRARRDLFVGEGGFGKEHEALIEDFIAERDLSDSHKGILGRIGHYLQRSRTARLLEARKGIDLVAFSIMDLGSSDYGFYMFNFRSGSIQVPGASDLLLWEMARLATEEGKRYLNLGLGVNPGIRHFKEKWGALPFLRYNWATIQKKRYGLQGIIRSMLKVGM